jgi:hypothetical protein
MSTWADESNRTSEYRRVSILAGGVISLVLRSLPDGITECHNDVGLAMDPSRVGGTQLKARDERSQCENCS